MTSGDTVRPGPAPEPKNVAGGLVTSAVPETDGATDWAVTTLGGLTTVLGIATTGATDCALTVAGGATTESLTCGTGATDLIVTDAGGATTVLDTERMPPRKLSKAEASPLVL
jgi:hypothetical protein